MSDLKFTAELARRLHQASAEAAQLSDWEWAVTCRDLGEPTAPRPSHPAVPPNA